MQPFIVKYRDSAGPVQVWIEADSAEQIRSTFADIEVLDELPGWSTPEYIEEFGTYPLHDIRSMPKPLQNRARK